MIGMNLKISTDSLPDGGVSSLKKIQILINYNFWNPSESSSQPETTSGDGDSSSGRFQPRNLDEFE